MRWLKPVFLTLLCLLYFVPLISAHDITVPTNAYFGLPTYGTYINFNTQQTFDTIKRESNYWYFGDYGFQVQNANMTITNYFTDNKLIFTVSAPSSVTSTTKVYVGDKGKPTSVTGATSYSYDSATQTVTVNVLHSSKQEIIIEWIVPSSLLAMFRSHYYVVLMFLGLVPLVVGAFITIAFIKGKEFETKEILGLVSLAMIVIVVFIIVWNVMNAIIGD